MGETPPRHPVILFLNLNKFSSDEKTKRAFSFFRALSDFFFSAIGVAHRHLPDTPSAAEVEARGLNLGPATANQQARIEELFLHLIELDKRVQALEAENRALRDRLERR